MPIFEVASKPCPERGRRLSVELQTAKIAELGWGDASLRGFAWENDGKDLRLFLIHASQPISELLCRWASDLRVDLNWHRPTNSTDERPIRRGGPLLTWTGRIEPTPGGRWLVLLDFASDGEIGAAMNQCGGSWEPPIQTAFAPTHLLGGSRLPMLYMVIEHFKGDPASVYRRFRDRGRLAPEGVRYVNSWVTSDLQRCYQVMDCDDRRLLEVWMENWQDLVDFEVVPVVTSAEAAAAIGPRL
jgi:hypothetical protein